MGLVALLLVSGTTRAQTGTERRGTKSRGTSTMPTQTGTERTGTTGALSTSTQTITQPGQPKPAGAAPVHEEEEIQEQTGISRATVTALSCTQSHPWTQSWLSTSRAGLKEKLPTRNWERSLGKEFPTSHQNHQEFLPSGAGVPQQGGEDTLHKVIPVFFFRSRGWKTLLLLSSPGG